jgi:hypothetical protein
MLYSIDIYTKQIVTKISHVLYSANSLGILVPSNAINETMQNLQIIDQWKEYKLNNV